MKKMFFIFLSAALVLAAAAGCARRTVTDGRSSREAAESSAPAETQLSSENEATVPNSSDCGSESCCESGVSAEESSEPSEESSEEPWYRCGDYVYTLTNNVARLVKYTGAETELALPAELDGHPLTALENGAFKDAGSLKRLTLGDAIVNVGAGALTGCTALEYLGVGSGTAVLCVADIALCENLSEIQVHPANASFSSRDGLLYNGGAAELLLCPRALNAKRLSLPDGLERIGKNAFAECRGVEEVQLPKGCELSEFSFFHCTSLKSVKLPDGLERIPEKCFFGCVRLVEATFPEGGSEIGRLAFFGCVAMKSVKLPSTLTSVGEDAFKCCSALKKISVSGEYGKMWYDKVGKALLEGKKS